ncbi:MAG: S9 family peptidase [Pseudoxanthomonas sp.]|jgi:dipeptidyl aminopeptidase/acylaminoacyl peptidase|uniref:S9 family peptidase n=1 Tax=Pseudoxanthomonas TaxID=83618 RepID=UPI0013896D86|nr:MULTISPECIES: S9 family peptidase [Pseudoxanthomonas]KAF1723618.1 S9 family peptidase [Pseudoxanthomonas mexicana]MCH2093105.1 S9 family peptidase [Pseudoxanthomonas sp.]
MRHPAFRLTLLASTVALALAAQAAPSAADRIAGTELIARDALFGNPERANVQISPDGKYLSWVAAVDGVLNVWVAPADNPSQARAVTQDKARGIRSYFWSYHPDTLLYLRDSGGDEDFHLYAVDLKTGQAKDLTPFPKTTAQVAGVSPKHPGTILVGMNDRDAQWHDIYKVDLASGNRTLLEKNDAQIAGYIADADYTLKYAQRSRPDGGADVLRRGANGAWEKFDDIPFEDVLTTSPGGLTLDGKTLYFTDSRGRNTAALFAIDVASGKRTLVLEDTRADVGGTLADPATGKVQAVSVDYLRDEWKVLDPAIRADLEKLEAIGPGDVSVNTRTLDDKTWIVAYSAAEAPLVYYRYDRGTGTLTKLFSARPKLEGKPLVPQWPVEIASRDNKTLVSYLTLPRSADANSDGKAETPVPLVLLVHGGPWARDSYGYGSYNQWLANRGYAVLSVNFRGSTGFGKDFTNAGNGEWAGKMHDDLIDAVQWAVKQGVTTQDQVAIMGGSYGGYATLTGLTFTPDAFACGVDIVGPSNLNTLLSTVPPYWASFFEQLAKRMGDPRTDAGKKWLTERSPLTRADQIKKPLLIGQGANDPRVKQAESDQIVKAMQAKNIPVTYVLFPDEGHGFARPENNKAFNAVTEGFLAQCLGGRAEPIGKDFTGSSISVPVGADGVPGLAEALKGHTQEVKK